MWLQTQTRLHVPDALFLSVSINQASGADARPGKEMLTANGLHMPAGLHFCWPPKPGAGSSQAWDPEQHDRDAILNNALWHSQQPAS